MRSVLPIILLITTGLIAQSIPDSQLEDPQQPIGFLNLKSDSLGTPLYVDGVYLGKSPLGRPIPVLPGPHEVSLFPTAELRPFIKNRLTASIKKIYVTENDTVDVLLYYDIQDQRIQAIRREQKMSASIGYLLVSVILSLLWIGAS